MRKSLLVVVLVLVSVSFLSAEASPRALGMIFQLKNLLLSIDSSNDGYQTGIGLKWWPRDQIALRGLLGLDFNSNNGQTWTELGASAGIEYHPVRGELSPYFGGYAGAHATMNVATAFALFFGGMVGAEMRVWKNVGIFAEYDLLVSFDDNGFSVATRAGGGAQLGLIIYF